MSVAEGLTEATATGAAILGVVAVEGVPISKVVSRLSLGLKHIPPQSDLIEIIGKYFTAWDEAALKFKSM